MGHGRRQPRASSASRRPGHDPKRSECLRWLKTSTWQHRIPYGDREGANVRPARQCLSISRTSMPLLPRGAAGRRRRISQFKLVSAPRSRLLTAGWLARLSRNTRVLPQARSALELPLRQRRDAAFALAADLDRPRRALSHESIAPCSSPSVLQQCWRPAFPRFAGRDAASCFPDASGCFPDASGCFPDAS